MQPRLCPQQEKAYEYDGQQFENIFDILLIPTYET